MTDPDAPATQAATRTCWHPGCTRPPVDQAPDGRWWCDDPDHNGCLFPGCVNEVKPRAAGQAKPNAYCFQVLPDSRGAEVRHDRNTAFAERNRLARAGRTGDAAGITDPTGRPVTYARTEAEVLREQLAKQFADLRTLADRSLSALATVGDPTAAQEEIQAVNAEAADMIASAERRAVEAERARRTAQTLLEEATGTAADMQTQRDEAVQRADRAGQAAADTEARAVEAERRASEAEAARHSAEADRDQALADQRTAETTAARAAERADQAVRDRQAAEQARTAAARDADQLRATLAELERKLATVTERLDAAVEARDTARRGAEDLSARLAETNQRLTETTADLRAANQARAVADQATEQVRNELAELRREYRETDQQLAAAQADLRAASEARAADAAHAEQRLADLRTMYEARLADLRGELDRLTTDDESSASATQPSPAGKRRSRPASPDA